MILDRAPLKAPVEETTSFSDLFLADAKSTDNDDTANNVPSVSSSHSADEEADFIPAIVTQFEFSFTTFPQNILKKQVLCSV